MSYQCVNGYDGEGCFDTTSVENLRFTMRVKAEPFERTNITLARGDAAWAWFQAALNTVTAWERSSMVSRALSEYRSAYGNDSVTDYMSRSCPGAASVPSTIYAVEGYVSAVVPCLEALGKVYDGWGTDAWARIKNAVAGLKRVAERVAFAREFRVYVGEVGARWSNARIQFLQAEVVVTAEAVAVLGEELQSLSADVGDLAGVVDVIIGVVELPPAVRAELTSRVDAISASRSRSVSVVRAVIKQMREQVERIETGSAVIQLDGAPVVTDVAPVASGSVKPLVVAAAAAGALWLFGGAK